MGYICNYFINKSNQELDIEIISYGWKLLTSSIVGTILVLLLALLLGRVDEAIIFLMSFVLLRRYTGGYHCSTCMRCNLLLIISYFGSTLWMSLNGNIYEYIVVLLSLIYIRLMAPIKNKNKLLSDKQLLNMKSKVNVITVTYLIILVF